LSSDRPNSTTGASVCLPEPTLSLINALGLETVNRCVEGVERMLGSRLGRWERTVRLGTASLGKVR